jgi:hypothetical protein
MPKTLGGLGQLADQVNEEIVGDDGVVIHAVARKAHKVGENGLVDRKAVHTNVAGRVCRVHCPRPYTRLKHLPNLAKESDAVSVTIQESRSNSIFVALLRDVDLGVPS